MAGRTLVPLSKSFVRADRVAHIRAEKQEDEPERYVVKVTVDTVESARTYSCLSNGTFAEIHARTVQPFLDADPGLVPVGPREWVRASAVVAVESDPRWAEVLLDMPHHTVKMFVSPPRGVSAGEELCTVIAAAVESDPDTLDILSGHPSPAVRVAVAGNPSAAAHVRSTAALG